MKFNLLLMLLFFSALASAQSKDEQEITEKTNLLSQTVFGTKSSATLEKLFAKTTSYGHSNGNLQTRPEAIKGLTENTSTYTDTAVSDIKIFKEGETAVVRHLFKAKEHKVDGSVVDLNFTMILVWIKENKEWKLMGRQAVSLK